MTKRLTIFYQNARMITMPKKKPNKFAKFFKLKRKGNPKSITTIPNRFRRFL